MKKKRISFTEDYAASIYEWCLGIRQIGTEQELIIDECFLCSNIKKRLEKFLGPKTVREIKKIVKEHPYFKNDGTCDKI